jgi:NADH-quinone oxidoreductase subunit E
LTDTIFKDKLKAIFSGYKGAKDELIPIMEAAQDEIGYLPPEVMLDISKFLKIPESAVYGVATFYALFRIKPSGKKMVRVCRGTACHVRGGSKILQEVEKCLGIKSGETTRDMEYSLETISCFGSCALSPVVVIDKTVYGRMTPSKVEGILGKIDKQ